MKRLFVRILCRFLSVLPDKRWIFIIFNHGMCLAKAIGFSIFCRKRKIQTSFPPTRRALILAPHMDDETIGCSGIIRKHVEQGARVAVLYLTDGAFGLSGRERTRRRKEREGEARAAASLLGIRRLYFLDQPDGYLQTTPRVVDAVRRIIAQERPDQIYLPYPYDSHHDHKQTFLIFAKAIRRLPPSSWNAYFYQTRVPVTWPDLSFVVDTSDVQAIKEQALGLYRSQSQFPFSKILHLQRCQAYLTSLSAKSVEVFCHLDRAAIPVISRNLQASGVSIHKYFQVGLYALRRKTWA